MEYLTLQNRRCEGDGIADDRFISAPGKPVVIIGGGDTGADCLGTAHRQGARSIHQFEILPRPPDQRASDNPWPQWPNVYRVSSAHEEGGERVYAVSTKRFVGDAHGRLAALEVVRVEMVRDAGRMSFAEVPGSEFTLPCELALLAMGFVGPERPGMLAALDVKLTDRGNVRRDENWMTSVPGVFTAGDMQRGQSLIVWAIAEGRSAARGSIATSWAARISPRPCVTRGGALEPAASARESSVASPARPGDRRAAHAAQAERPVAAPLRLARVEYVRAPARRRNRLEAEASRPFDDLARPGLCQSTWPMKNGPSDCR